MKKSTILIATLICCFAAGFLSISLPANASAKYVDNYDYYCVNNPDYTCSSWISTVRYGNCDKCGLDEIGYLYKIYTVYVVYDLDGYFVTTFKIFNNLYCDCVPDVHPHEKP